MKMNSKDFLNELVSKGKLKKQTTDMGYLNGLIEAAKRNFDAAALVKNKVDEAAFKLIYDGLLQISRAVVMLNGYRPDDGEQHKTTFLAAGELMGGEFHDLTDRIQKFRIKRNNCVYEPKGLITGSEVDAILNTAKEYWPRVKRYLQSKNPQLKLFKDI
jgi:uncharacterized protein (UPF0332 family)